MPDSKHLKARVETKIDTSVSWRQNNPTLLNGELGIESDTCMVKIGDGVTAWNDLDSYTNAGQSIVASTAYVAEDSLALGGTSYTDWNLKFDNYVLNTRIEASMSTASAAEKIPTSQAIIAWVKAQNFAGSGDVTTWTDF